jgi:predicted dehydrogenase
MRLEMSDRPVGFGVIGVDHNHIYRMAQDMLANGARLRGWWTRTRPEPPGAGVEPFADTLRAADYRSLLDDPEIDLVLVCAIPAERAKLSMEAMQAGKDVVSDKPGATTLEDLGQLRATAAATGRFWSVNFSERYWVRAAVKAAEVIREGRIGEVIHTAGLGPHRGMFSRRQPWFFERDLGGGILCDIGAHQVDHFLFYTGSQQVQVVSAALGNFTLPEHPRFEDFGELLLQGERASGYARVDWLTPDAQPYPGDSRLTILGTKGAIEIRKYVDLGGRPGMDHLFVAYGGEFERVDCSSVKPHYAADILRDVRGRTSTAERPGHSFLVTELTLRAQAEARLLGHLAQGATSQS